MDENTEHAGHTKYTQDCDVNQYLAYGRFIGLVRKFTSIRLMSYTSELVEAGRPVLLKSLVWVGYGVSIVYVLGDVAVKVNDVKNRGTDVMKYTALDAGLWHTSASLVVPAVTIHGIVGGVSRFQGYLANSRKIGLPKFFKFVPTVVGLLSIPLIIHPIDHGTDYVMNRFVRPIYSDRLEKKAN
jgi:fission process protein 1